MDLLTQTEDHLRDLISFATVSCDPNLDMMHHMANRLEDAGARVEVFQDESGKKANIFASIGPDCPGGLLLSGHSDVVPVTDQDWTSDPFELSERGDLLMGRGTCDMKGFIAACLTYARHYAELTLRRPIHFCFTHDEETGCLGAQALVPELKKRGIAPSIAIIGEPTEMRIIEGHKGCCEYTTRFSGLEGHGSNPDRGVNAVAYAVKYATRLMELAEDLKGRAPRESRFDPPWTSISIGRLNGGHAHNVIPAKAELDWEMRPVQYGDAEFVKDALTQYIETELLPSMRAVSPRADISTQIIGEVAGLEPMDVNMARTLVATLTGQNAVDVVPFCTEGGIFQQMGMSVVVCGPGSIAQAHKADEYVSRAQLAECLTLLDGFGHSCAA
ncbi:acetylornithine deacetylase ArgE [Puniceibacterium sp. IMCC21224]|nr:acetylornithine deacetylase [Puniceibacterium sp. IMCC21224]KMK68641.1 acetylornithine deacetylase ArgE [Puniceibacterium sp. IMCC21224]